MPVFAPDADSISAACRRRLADGPSLRWLWAFGSGLICSGVVWLMAIGLLVLVWHGVRRRTLLPAVYGLTLFGGFAFALASFEAVLPLSSGTGSGPASPTGWPPLVWLAGVAVFAFGHRQGQEKAARDGRRWLDLDG
jgi:hypothetical protein